MTWMESRIAGRKLWAQDLISLTLDISVAPFTPGQYVNLALDLGADRVKESRPGEYTIGATATPTLIADLAAWLRDHDVQLDELRGSRRSLEEVFLRLTREGRE